jgi:hypothetical protein
MVTLDISFVVRRARGYFVVLVRPDERFNLGLVSGLFTVTIILTLVSERFLNL